ncbi:predicted protein [Nematostella vectensis]|uniref:FERM, RhoGEF and pleckstrin domain-containing protein 2 n=1 Tax=Nematostella vectensis TaxID=45351 RepID=A7SRN5_NEMVE|nr:predicted protein [Nematostella vectensis]|eukprot:XP_001625726.1 predicted protein [Nematostella vectensis]
MARRYDVNEPGSGGRRGRRRGQTTVKVCMLDDSVVKFDIEPKVKGDILYKQVYEYLNLDEREYFGLSYYDKSDNLFWLDQLKPIKKQVKEIGKVLFRFCVKFYTADPAMLQEEYTRYLFALQVKKDLVNGGLKCSESTAALLASYVVQGELGDFDTLSCRPGYLADFQFFPEQTVDSEARISDFHKQHRSLSPTDCDYNLLDVARRLEMYGVILYPAKDKDNVDLELAAANMGIIVFQSGSKINTLSWAKIRKLSFKRKRFLIKLHPEIFGHYKDVVEFQMASRNACKSFWKVAISTHAFFRQSESQSPPRHRPRVFSRGSSYRFSGRTQKQIIDSMQDSFRSQPSFQRTQSLKTPARNNLPHTSQSSASGFPRPYNAYSESENRIVEPMPPQEQVPEQQEKPEQEVPVPAIELPPDNEQEEQGDIPIEESEPNGPVIKVQSAENPDEDIPLKDLDDEPDMMKDESSSAESVHDLEWQEELDRPEEEHQGEDENSTSYRYPTPKIVYSAEESKENRKSDIIIPPGVDHIAVQPQPRPPTPIEVDGIDSPSPPPPPPEEDDISEELVDEVQEFPVSPAETLPSPPPELLRDSPDPESLQGKSEHTNGIHQNGFHLEQSIETSYQVKVQNGGVVRHGKGSQSSQVSTDDDPDTQTENRDNVFEEQASPKFRSDNEYSPPSSPKMMFKSDQMLSKAGSSAAYNIAKELLNTERTYVKDLEVITIAFREVVSSPGVLPEATKKLLFSTIDPIYDFHCAFLSELEERMTLWDQSFTTSTGTEPRIGDLMHKNMKQIKRYVHHLKKHDEVMLELEAATKKFKQFELAYKEFETQKICYLPLNAFLLKPSQRLLHYRFLLERLLKYCVRDSEDSQDIQGALEELVGAVKSTEESMKKLENFQKIIELQRDLIGVDNLVQQGREFIREGCLQKMTRKGPQPRMFFLFSDLLLYTCKGVTLTNQFRVRGQIPLHTVKLEDTGPELHGLFPFNINFSNKHMTVAAPSEEEKYKWLEDLQVVVRQAKESASCSQCLYNRANMMVKAPNLHGTTYLCDECYIINNEDDDSCRNGESDHHVVGRVGKIFPLPTPVNIHRSFSDGESDDDAAVTSPVTSLDRRHAHCHTMSTRRVCWHRNTSVSMHEHALSVRNQMSGDLLRKFKTGNRWQKLWVVFTNFCLFFYKTHEDEFPLANLPLIGYTVDRPSEGDNIEKDLVFKLQYKTHVYFFRSENEYSFHRWMEVIASATQGSTRTRIFSRMDSSIQP